MLTVGNDAGRVERLLEEGGLSCPDCGGRLAGWGHGRRREVFGPGRRTRRVVRPRRSRCAACRVTHMLLPAWMLLRRMDEAAVAGAALAAAARGLGYRRAARVRGREKVPVCGRVEVPAGGQLKVPVPRSSCRPGG